jgi:hypothetical protein
MTEELIKHVEPQAPEGASGLELAPEQVEALVESSE